VNYTATVIDHFRSPRNAGTLRRPDAVGESEDGNCGDLARFHLRIEAGRVTEARFQTYGCGPAIAASSLATELVRGRAVESLTQLTAEEIEGALGGLPESRRHAAGVVAAAMRAAAANGRGSTTGEVRGV
jgi:nitrogen fixation NifU-like protein